MDIHKILYATDFSANSQVALECASALAAAGNAKLIIAHIDDTTPGLVFGDVGYGYLPQIDAVAREEYQALQAVIPTRSRVPYEHRFFRGDAADGILHIADEEHVDFIVIGTHGKSELKLLLMGSVADAVVRRSKCPVLTVSQPAEASQESSLSHETASRP